MERKTGKTVHFLVTDPKDETYREIIKNLEYILIPEANGNGQKMSEDTRTEFNNEIKSYLENGDSVVLFPEGHTFGKENIGPFQKGLYHLSQQNPDVPIIPLRVDGFDEPYTKIKLTIGSPEKLSPANGKKEICKIIEAFRQKIFVEQLGLIPVENRNQ